MIRPSRRKVALHTFGCRLNQSETNALRNLFAEKDYDVVKLTEAPDIVVVNTCTVTENGDADTRRLVKRISRMNPDAKIALIGCQAQVQKERLLEMPNVRWVIGNEKKMEAVSIMKEFREEPQVITPPVRKTSFTVPIAEGDALHTRANLKIQDGCDFFCSFCEIPYARGRARSRQFGDILSQARAFVRAGHKEIVLTGINIGTFRDNNKGIVDIVSALEDLDGLERIRLSSIEPTTIPWALIRKMSKSGKLCRYLHVPVQSGSDDLLALMQRRYKSGYFRDFILKIRESVPEVCLGTDIIVGFPGETDFFFAQTYEMVKNLPFAYFHVFSYSRRNLAQSRRLKGTVAPTVIQERSRRIRELGFRKRRAFIHGLLKTTQRVLFEDKKAGMWMGLTDNYVRVRLSSDKDLRNRVHSVRLYAADKDLVFGEIVHLDKGIGVMA